MFQFTGEKKEGKIEFSLSGSLGYVLYGGNDMIPFYRLRRKIDGRCPSCKRKLAIRPLSIKY